MKTSIILRGLDWGGTRLGQAVCLRQSGLSGWHDIVGEWRQGNCFRIKGLSGDRDKVSGYGDRILWITCGWK